MKQNGNIPEQSGVCEIQKDHEIFLWLHRSDVSNVISSQGANCSPRVFVSWQIAVSKFSHKSCTPTDRICPAEINEIRVWKAATGCDFTGNFDDNVQLVFFSFSFCLSSEVCSWSKPRDQMKNCTNRLHKRFSEEFQIIKTKNGNETKKKNSKQFIQKKKTWDKKVKWLTPPQKKSAILSPWIWLAICQHRIFLYPN